MQSKLQVSSSVSCCSCHLSIKKQNKTKNTNKQKNQPTNQNHTKPPQNIPNKQKEENLQLYNVVHNVTMIFLKKQLNCHASLLKCLLGRDNIGSGLDVIYSTLQNSGK